MKYQLGDKIILLHSEEEGEIIDFINDKMVMVDVKGVKFPVHLDQIDFPYFKRFSKSKTGKSFTKEKPTIDTIKKEKPGSRYQVAEGVWLVFLPVFDKDVFDDDIVEYFKIFLVNQTKDHFTFNYSLKYAGEPGFDLKNEIFPLSDFYLHDIPFENINDSPKFDFDFQLRNADKKRVDHFETSLKIKPKQLFKKIEEIRLNQQAHFSYPLFTEYPDRPEEMKMEMDQLTRAGYKVYDASRPRANPEQGRTVIDLHADKLTDNWKSLSPLAILDLQLKTFDKFYDLAVMNHQDQLIVIHGVGTGKLRDEIHDLLRLKKEVKSFVNQYHPSFGYGATEIYFQYR